MDLRFGFWTRLAWWCWLALYALTLYFRSSGDTGYVVEFDARDFFLRMFSIGLVYGAVSQGVWILGGLSSRPLRLVGASLLTIVGAILLSVQTVESSQVIGFLKGLANLAGMMIAQSIVFFLLGIVSWQHSGATRPRRPRQFSTLDIVFLTLATAIVLSILIRLSTPISASDYWLVAAGIWLALPCISAAASFASIGATPGRRIVSAGLAILIAATGCAGLVALENVYGPRPSATNALLAKFYGTLLATFCGFCLLIPRMGRIDEARFQQRHQTDGSPGD